MAKLVALYRMPQDAAHFDAHYFGKHVPLASPEGQATGADLANFATGGVDLLVFETQEVQV